jgi:hypothetical protein
MANFPRLVAESHAAITVAQSLRGYAELRGLGAPIGEPCRGKAPDVVRALQFAAKAPAALKRPGFLVAVTRSAVFSR